MSWDIFQQQFHKKFEVMLIAHRGARYEALENTLQAFELAVDAGAEMIEFDIHKTIDDHVVVIHDTTTERVSDVNIDIHTSTLEQVREVKLEGNLQIPTLDEVFSQLKGKIYFQIEIKQNGIAPFVMDLIEKYNVHDQCVISSFLHPTLHHFKKSTKKLMLASLEPTEKHERYRNLLRNWMVNNTKKLGFDGYHPEYTLVTPKIVRKAHSKNLFVNTWTADTPKDWGYLIECGVDGIMTNYPRELYKFLESL